MAAGLVGPDALAERTSVDSNEQATTRLTTAGTSFAINGEPTFLLGLSYYGGLGAPEEAIVSDLADLRTYGFNWIRVWATWGGFENDVSAVDAEGRPREAFLNKLTWLVDVCDRQGIVVDVTLSRGNGVAGPSRLQTLEAHRRAVTAIVTALREHQNWYIDLGNERSMSDGRFVSMNDLRALRELARGLDTDLLVTASHHGVDLKKDDVRDYLEQARVDFLSPHRPRHAASPGETAEYTRQLLVWMKEWGREIPVHYQEPFRRGYGAWQPLAADFVADLAGAKRGGAAGWCFHNGDQRKAPDGQPRRSFDLRARRLFEQLDEEETGVLHRLAPAAGLAVPRGNSHDSRGADRGPQSDSGA